MESKDRRYFSFFFSLFQIDEKIETWRSNFQIGVDVVADRGPIPGRDRCRRCFLPVDVAAPPPTAAAPAPLEAGCRLVGVEQRRPGHRPIGHRGRRRHPRRPARWRRLAVSMEADARPADAGASVAERRGRHPEPRQPRFRVLPAKGWVRDGCLMKWSSDQFENCCKGGKSVREIRINPLIFIESNWSRTWSILKNDYCPRRDIVFRIFSCKNQATWIYIGEIF